VLIKKVIGLSAFNVRFWIGIVFFFYSVLGFFVTLDSNHPIAFFNSSLIIFVDILSPLTLKKRQKFLGFDSCTTPIQQVYNNPSHEGGSHF
jgi:hypothetical protein